MMDLVLDTNIVISGLITPNGTISRLVIRDLPGSRLLCPDFLIEEVFSNFSKIKKFTRLQDDELYSMIFRFFKRIEFIDHHLIEFRYQKHAFDLVKSIDKKDLLFVALSIQTGYPLWTGDKKLLNGLKERGFKNIISTDQLLDQF